MSIRAPDIRFNREGQRKLMKFSRLILKNILRNKRRTLLTVSSLVVSLFLIITLATILTEFTQGHEQANPMRLVTRHAVSLGFVLPAAQAQRIATVPGVKSVMPFSWFGGIYIDEKNFFANFGETSSLITGGSKSGAIFFACSMSGRMSLRASISFSVGTKTLPANSRA